MVPLNLAMCPSKVQEEIKSCSLFSWSVVSLSCSLVRHVCVINQRHGKDERKEIKGVEESHGIALIGGETTRCEHYGGGSSNRVASDVAGEEVMDPGKVKMVMNVSNGMSSYMLPVKKNKSKGVELVTLYVTEAEVGCQERFIIAIIRIKADVRLKGVNKRLRG
ncbi:hypothetical protein Tco_1262017 [Tanacetum coccineum]